MAAASVTHPFDLIKVRLQTSPDPKKASGIRTAMGIIKNEGIPGIYRGLSASLLRQATYSTMRFGTYDKAKDFLGKDGEELSFSKKILSGAIGGAVGGACGNPADVVMVRMENDTVLEPHLRRNYRNAFDGLYHVVKEEGVKGLFRGVGPNVNRAVLMTTSQLSTYDQFKYLLLQTGYFKDNIWTHFSASLLSGLVATTICSPVDVVKTRIMDSNKATGSALRMAITMVRQEGPLSLFKGWVPSFVRLGPHTVITFIVLEKLREISVSHELFGIKLPSFHS